MPSAATRWTARFLAMAMVAALLGLVAPATASALAVFDVTTTLDDGSPGSLRARLDQAATSGDDALIQLESGQTYVVDRLCTHGDLDDNHGGDLDWTSDDDLIIHARSSQPATIEVRCAGERVIDHRGLGQLTLRRVRITGGNPSNGTAGSSGGVVDGGSAPNGGGVRAIGRLRLESSIVEGNETGSGGFGATPMAAGSGGHGGAGGDGGGIMANVVELHDSQIIDNRTGRGGDAGDGNGGNVGGIGGRGGDGAGVWALNATVTATTIDGNIAGRGGSGGDGSVNGHGGTGGAGGRMGGMYAGIADVEHSTVSANTAGDGGAGGAGAGAIGDGGAGGAAGISGGMRGFDVDVVNTTIHANQGGAPGSGGPGSPAGGSGLLSTGGGLAIVSSGAIEFSTITENESGAASNIAANPVVTIVASVVGAPGGTGANCSGFLVSGGWNVSDSGSCGIGTPTDLVSGSLGLGPLTDNGGPTLTRLPVVGGPLHDRIPRATCAGLIGTPAVDQRYERREIGGCEPGSVEIAPKGASAFVPLPPERVFDTRNPAPPSGFIGAGQTLTVQFTGASGVPATGVTAVAFNLTVAAAGGEGFVTAWPGGAPRPLASNLNTVRNGQIVPNMVIVPVGPGGTVNFYTQSGAHLLADIAGYFVEAGVARGGRIIPVTPQRLFDTRDAAAPSGFVGAGVEIAVPVLGKAGVPSSGVSAVVMNLTGTAAAAAGFVTAWPGGKARPVASNLNLSGAGHTAPNLVMMPVGSDGTIRFYSQSGAHLLADVTAYVTDATALPASTGLMVPLDPARVFDTRTGAAPSGFVGAGSQVSASHGGVAGVPGHAAGVVLNATATQSGGAGFVTAWPADVGQPLASTLNLTEVGETRANAAILPIGAGGGIRYFTQSGAHLLADAFGYLLPESSVS